MSFFLTLQWITALLIYRCHCLAEARTKQSTVNKKGGWWQTWGRLSNQLAGVKKNSGWGGYRAWSWDSMELGVGEGGGWLKLVKMARAWGLLGFRLGGRIRCEKQERTGIWFRLTRRLDLTYTYKIKGCAIGVAHRREAQLVSVQILVGESWRQSRSLGEP